LLKHYVTYVIKRSDQDTLIPRHFACNRFDHDVRAMLTHIDYDFALTSPPYWDTKNVEIYELMKIWKTQQEFYEDFLIPLINKTRASIRRNGKVAFNISPKMYKILTEKYKYPACEEAVPMLQQKVRGKDKEDMVYVW